MNILRRRALALAAILGTLSLLGACGQAESTAGPESGEQMRTVVDATGASIEVPQQPERIITGHYAATHALADLGVYPVGQGSFRPNLVPAELLPKIADVPLVAADAEINVEQVAELAPDLILMPNTFDEAVVNQLRDIAPVYVFTLRGGDRAKWTQRVEEIGDAIGATEEVKRLSQSFQDRQQQIATDYADVISGKTIGVIGAYTPGNFYAWGSDNMVGTIIVPLGFTYSAQEDAAVANEKEPEGEISYEQIGSVVGDADILLYDSDLRGEPSPSMQDLQGNRVYQELPAVKAGNAFAAGKNQVAGFGDANYTLDRVEEALNQMRG